MFDFFFRRRRLQNRNASRRLQRRPTRRPLVADVLEERCVLTTEELINLTNNDAGSSTDGYFLSDDDRYAVYTTYSSATGAYSMYLHDVTSGARTLVVERPKTIWGGNPFLPGSVAAVTSNGSRVVMSADLYDWGGVYEVGSNQLAQFFPVIKRTDPNNVEHTVDLFNGGLSIVNYLGVSGDGQYAFFASNHAWDYQLTPYTDHEGKVTYSLQPQSNADRRFAIWRMPAVADREQQAAGLERWTEYGLFGYRVQSSGRTFWANVSTSGVSRNGDTILFAATDSEGVVQQRYVSYGGAAQSTVTLPDHSDVMALNHAGTAYAYVRSTTNAEGHIVRELGIAGFSGNARLLGPRSMDGYYSSFSGVGFSGDDQRLYYVNRVPGPADDTHAFVINVDGTGDRVAFAHSQFRVGDDDGIYEPRVGNQALLVSRGSSTGYDVWLLRDVEKRADLHVKLASDPDAAFGLDDVYQTVPAGEQIERTERTDDYGSVRFHVRVQNDGATATKFIVDTVRDDGHSTFLNDHIIVRVDGQVVTAQFPPGGYLTPILAPGEVHLLEVEVPYNQTGHFNFRVRADGAAPTSDIVRIRQVDPVKPDLGIKKPFPVLGAYQGDGVYQTTVPEGVQVLRQKVQPGASVVSHVVVQNDNPDFLNRFLLRAAETVPAGWTVQYKLHAPALFGNGARPDFDTGTDITAALRSPEGFLTPSASEWVQNGYPYGISITITRAANTADDPPDASTILAVYDQDGLKLRDQVQAVAQAERLELVVNTTLDETDKNADPNVIDVDLKTPGNQISLRAAIEYANAKAGADVITFNIPVAGTGAPTIKIFSALPTIGEDVTIDASTQSGGKVILDGAKAGTKVNGLTIIGQDTGIRNLEIKGFRGHGIKADHSINLWGMSIHDNVGWGVYAVGTVDIGNSIDSGGTDLNGTTDGPKSSFFKNGNSTNHNGGIVSIQGFVRAYNVEVYDNWGPGIVADEGVTLVGTLGPLKILRNRGDGVNSWDGDVGIYGGGLTHEIVGNYGWGVYAKHSIVAEAALNVANNASWGMIASMVIVGRAAGNTVTTPQLTTVKGNGKGNLAYALNLDENGPEIQQRSRRVIRGGGIQAYGFDILAGSIAVTDNNGPGLAARRKVWVNNGTDFTLDISRNNGHGIQTGDDEINIRGSVVGGVEIADNKGYGVIAGANSGPQGKDVEISPNVRIHDNAGSGIFGRNVTLGYYSGTTAPGIARVYKNGNAPSGVLGVDFELAGDGPELVTQMLPKPNGGYAGVRALGWVKANNLSVEGNLGPGIVAEQNVELAGSETKVGANRGNGIESEGDVLVTHKITADDNYGFGIVARGKVNIGAIARDAGSTVRSSISNNRLGGIVVEGMLDVIFAAISNNGKFANAADEGNGILAGDAVTLEDVWADANRKLGVRADDASVKFRGGVATGDNSVSRNGKGGIYAGSVWVDKTIVVDANRGRGIEAVDPLAIVSVAINDADPGIGSPNRSSVSRNKLKGIQAVGPVELHRTDVLSNGVG